jgi:hypothetical protein
LYVQGKISEPIGIITDWKPQISVEDLCKLQPLDFINITKVPELLEEFQEECLLYKFYIHTCICFFVAEQSKKLGYDYSKWLEIARRYAKVVPKDWPIYKKLFNGTASIKAKKSKSVRNHEIKLANRKASFSPEKHNNFLQPLTPSNMTYNNTKGFPEFSKRLKKKSKFL